MRINRYLARAGVASRRKVEELISSGKVKVNGNIITSLSTTIEPNKDEVFLEGARIELPKQIYLMLNKPVGYTTTRADAHAEKTVFELLPVDSSLITVGRLDRETSGLLLVTNDGDFAQNIIHPSQKIEKIYIATLGKGISEPDLEKLVKGVVLEDGPAKFTYAKSIGDNKVEVGIEEGRNKIVRRMFDIVSNPVKSLERIRIGTITLDVPPGEYRELSQEEVARYA